MTQRSIKHLWYHHQKSINPNFHPLPWGGARNLKFPPAERARLESTLWTIITTNPTLTFSGIRQKLQQVNANWNVNKNFISRQFKQWNLTFKNIKYWHVTKYTVENLQRSLELIQLVHTIQHSRLVWMDEISFCNIECLRKKGWALAGRRLEITANISRDDSLSVIAFLRSDANKPMYLATHKHTNNQWDIATAFISAIQDGFLKRGDIVILDNASIHMAQDSRVILNHIFNLAGIQLSFLPTYSPDLNPIEFIFGIVKNLLYTHRQPTDDFETSVFAAFSAITQHDVDSTIQHCYYH